MKNKKRRHTDNAFFIYWLATKLQIIQKGFIQLFKRTLKRVS
ncbi:hypothetical protein GA0061071_101369 [Kosakonia oryzendophytica]|uniref:Uncharacterized protein n=1 Tax=Kosakonia oryzendophytica TaxID=1005665 RepID=A0A1C3Z579_9ENTR|nr:hypothetical protein DFO53_0289 [Enterobacter sp. AG5470]SCB77499.1 hypothetical protein GA0061071_101369 [Kosakonia oryzendophytica]